MSVDYSPQTSSQSNYTQHNGNSGQTFSDPHPSNVWTNNTYKSGNTSNQANPSASDMLTNAQPQSNSTNWIPDSGASFHVTSESEYSIARAL